MQARNSQSRPVRVSVCIPTYNRGVLVQSAVQSALQQDVDGLEVIVCDNASTDDTFDRIQTLRSSPENRRQLLYYRNPVNLGMTSNFRRALELARGEFACFLCSDDLLYSGALREALGALQSEPGTVFAFAQVEYIGGRSGRTSHRFPAVMEGRKYAARSLSRAVNFAHLNTTTFRLKDALAVGITDLLFFDWCLWLQLALRGKVCFVDRVLGAHRYHNSNETNMQVNSPVEECLELSRVLERLSVLDARRLKEQRLWSTVRVGRSKLYLRYVSLAVDRWGWSPFDAQKTLEQFRGVTADPITRILGCAVPFWTIGMRSAATVRSSPWMAPRRRRE